MSNEPEHLVWQLILIQLAVAIDMSICMSVGVAAHREAFSSVLILEDDFSPKKMECDYGRAKAAIRTTRRPFLPIYLSAF